MLKTIRSRIAAGASVIALVAVALSMTIASAQDEPTLTRTDKIKVGTYESQRALHSYHKTEEFIAFIQGLEVEAQAAQEAGNFARLMEMQTEAQQREQALLQSFNTAIDKAMPKIAGQQNLQVIALELIYHDPSIEPRDITDDVIREINADADAATAPGANDDDDE